MPRSELVAKICSHCNTFEHMNYECPYIQNLTKMFKILLSVRESHPELESVDLRIGCEEFEESRKKHVL